MTVVVTVTVGVLVTVVVTVTVGVLVFGGLVPSGLHSG